jgi:hypothetical protein
MILTAGTGLSLLREKAVLLLGLMILLGCLGDTRRCWLSVGMIGRMEAKNTYSDLWIARLEEHGVNHRIVTQY